MPPDSLDFQQVLNELALLRRRVDQFEETLSRTALLESLPEGAKKTSALELVIETLSEGLTICDLDGNILTVNRAGLEMRGFQHRDELPENLNRLYELISFHDLSGRELLRDECPINRALSGESFADRELMVRRLDKNFERLLSFSGAPVKDRAGQPLLAIVTSRDVTEKRLAEETLRVSEIRYRTLYEKMTQGVIYYDDQGKMLSANPAAEEILGLDLKPGRGIGLMDPVRLAVHEDGRLFEPEEHPCRIALSMGKRVRDVIMGIYNYREAEPRWIVVDSTPQFHPGAKTPSGVFTLFRDITDLKRAQDETERIRRDLEAGFAAMVDAVILHDAQGRARFKNPACERMFGAESCDSYEQWLNVFEIKKPDGSIPAKEIFPVLRALRGESVVREEYVVRRRSDDHVMTQLVSAAPTRKPSGEIDGAIVLYTDISELKRLENDLLRAKEAAEEASEAKSQLLANMSHELRTPISGILGMAEILRSRMGDAECGQFANNIHQAGRALNELVNQILDFSKIEGGIPKITAREFELDADLRDALQLFSEPARQKGDSLEAKIDPRLPKTLIGDAFRLNQVLRNLLSNAVKFTSNGVIEVEVVRQEQVDDRVNVLLIVKDTGQGIPKDKQSRIFEDFYQAEDHLTKEHAGAGLGLAIARKVVLAMGGRIWFESEEGQGSSFFVSLPFGWKADRSDDSMPETGGESHLRDWPPLRFLVAEDNRINQVFIRAMLKDLGHSVSIAGTGTEALALLERDPFDLVLMDIQMPEMDGLTAIRHIRNLDAPVSRIPIIALTAYMQQRDKDRILESGADWCLTKPLNFDELARAMSALGIQAVGKSAPEAGTFSTINEAMRDYFKRKPHLFHKICVEFSEGIQELSVKIQAAFANRKGDEAALLSHSLAGMASMVGLDRIAEDARNLEDLFNGRDWDAAENILKTLTQAVPRSSAQLRALAADLKEILDKSDEKAATGGQS